MRPLQVTRYASLINTPAIDHKPANSHAWLNRASALTRWAAMNPGTALSQICKDQARTAIVRSRVCVP